jgi:prefoldin subunit 5
MKATELKSLIDNYQSEIKKLNKLRFEIKEKNQMFYEIEFENKFIHLLSYLALKFFKETIEFYKLKIEHLKQSKQ